MNKKLSFIFSILAFTVFQVFNYSVTNYALTDVLGELSVLPFIISIALCANDLLVFINPNSDKIDFWYIFGAWVLVSATNATLSWWG